MARAAAEAAADALSTHQQLAELAYAGVVDAGGRGMLVLLDSMVQAYRVANRRRNYRGLLNEGNSPAQRRRGVRRQQ